MAATTSNSIPLLGDNSWQERLARFGLLGKALIHLIAGFLAVQLAFDRSSEDAGSTGAVDWVDRQAWGTPVLVALAASLGALAIWRATEVVTGDPVEGSEWHHRLRFGAKAILYGALAAITMSAAFAGGGGSASGSSGGGSDAASTATSTVFDLPAGRMVVIGAGLAIVIAAGVVFYKHAWRAQFEQRVSIDDDSAVAVVGRIGYGGRSIAYAAAGLFLLDAGISHDPEQAKSLGQSLRAIADASWGPLVLCGIGAGFLAYGAFCVAEALLRKDA